MQVVTSDVEYLPDSREERLVDFTIAYYNHNVESVLSFLADDATWEAIDTQTLSGRDQIRAYLNNLRSRNVHKMCIRNVFSTDTNAAISIRGESDENHTAYLFLLAFKNKKTNAPITNVECYSIKLKTQ